MNLHSILTAMLAIGWCVTIFLALAGWGVLAAKAMRIAAPGIGLAVALGLAVQCLLGGALNLAHGICPAILLSIVAIGLIAFALHYADARHRDAAAQLFWRDYHGRILLHIVLVLIAVRLLAFVRPDVYNPWDDFQAYMVLPWKMLQLHHFAADPLSQRRVISSLGFSYYLQAIFLTLAPMKNIALVDGGLGTLTLAAVALGIARTMNLKRGETIVFLLLAAYTKQIPSNLGFAWLPCALYLAMALIASRDDLQDSTLQPLCLGAAGAAATALKNTHLIFAVLFVLVLYALLAFMPYSPALPDGTSCLQRIRYFLRHCTLAAAGALAVLVLWMLDMHHYSGTFLFPILGYGYEFSSYHLLQSREVSSPLILLKCVIAGIPLLLLSALEAWWLRGMQRSRAAVSMLAVTITGALATIATGVASGSDSIRRYTYPEMMAALLVLFPLVCHLMAQRKMPIRYARLCKLAAASLIVMAFLSGYWTRKMGFYMSPQDVLRDVRSSLRNEELVPPETIAEYQAAEAAIPPHSVVLETVSYAYLLNNNHATYYETSVPAMASPPPAPGWPIFSDGETLSAWLLSHDVRYILYSYGDYALEDTPSIPVMLADPHLTVILRSTKIAIIRAQQQYMELAVSRKRLYDDGMLVVIDLATPAPADPPPLKAVR